MSKYRYDVVIGLEVHVQLKTKSKIFSSAPTEFGAMPNSQVSVVCAGLPGTLPVLNRKVFELGIRAVLALEGKVSSVVKFDRKNYFYPDLPKGYQISQFDKPLGRDGRVDIVVGDQTRTIRIHRLHLEEDAGKNMHMDDSSLVDLNRAGVPLIEIVSEPDLKTSEEAYVYLTNMKAILKSAGVSDVDMEKGQLRCDVNVSVRKSPQDPLGTKVEIKNVNSFKFVRSALEYEIERQSQLMDQNERIVQETRLWDDPSGKTYSMRLKEEAHDYRYFPDPDLVPFIVEDKWVRDIQASMPELPAAKHDRFKQTYALSDYDVQWVLSETEYEELFLSLATSYPSYKNLVNWLMGPVIAVSNELRIPLQEVLWDKDEFVNLLKWIDEGKISFKAAKEEVFPIYSKDKKKPNVIIDEKGLTQISDQSFLEDIIQKVVQDNPKSVEDYKSGKANAISFLIGQVMRQTKGKANPNLVSSMIAQKLEAK